MIVTSRESFDPLHEAGANVLCGVPRPQGVGVSQHDPFGRPTLLSERQPVGERLADPLFGEVGVVFVADRLTVPDQMDIGSELRCGSRSAGPDDAVTTQRRADRVGRVATGTICRRPAVVLHEPRGGGIVGLPVGHRQAVVRFAVASDIAGFFDADPVGHHCLTNGPS